MRGMEIPESLRQRVEEFVAVCQVQPRMDELFTESSWFQVLAGQGLIPRSWNPIADRYSEQDLAGFLGAVEKAVLETVRPMPRHIDFLAALCAEQPAVHAA